MARPQTPLWPFMLLVLAGACASLLMLWITTYGLGISPDSMVYMETAK
jgi:hypothetical protein